MPDPLPLGSGTQTPEPLDESQFELRPDGSVKGLGFLGPFKIPGGTAGEYSIADSEKLKDGNKYLDYPSIVPTLTRDELLATLKAAEKGTDVPQSVKDKAEAFALHRRSQGLPLFARPGEQLTLYPDIPRVAIRRQSGDIALPNESGQRDPRLGSLGYGGR